MTDTTSAGDEVELPEPDIFAWLVETDDSYEAMTDPGWTEASVRAYADARAARAVEQEWARVDVVREALTRIRRGMVHDSRDWSTARLDAWLYGMLVGWDDEDADDTGDAMNEVAETLGWSAEECARLRRYHSAIVDLIERGDHTQT